MPRIFNTAKRVHSLLRSFPTLLKKIDSVCMEFHRIQENHSSDIAANGERWLVQTLAKRNRLKIVFDVGANHGDWAAEVLMANPAATIHCFEISPPTFQKLSTRLSPNKGNVLLNPFGLSEATGEIKIKHCPEGDGLTTMFDVVAGLKSEMIGARVARGEDYCVAHGIQTIDLLKIDVEGAEHLVLKGFGDALVSDKVPVVQFEYGMVNVLTKFLLRDFYQFFGDRGYKVGKLFPRSVRFCDYRFQDEDFLGPNYVAAVPELCGLLEAGN